MSVATSQVRLTDPYELHPDQITEPPRSMWGILKRIGPGMILSASIVGSGELIATTTLGAEVGYTALWIIILSCIIKPAVQSELGRYIIATDKPAPKVSITCRDREPEESIGRCGRGRFMCLITWFQIGAMFGGVGAGDESDLSRGSGRGVGPRAACDLAVSAAGRRL